MSWSDVWKIVLSAIGSAGGIGVIIVLIVKFTVNNIAEQLAKKYELKLQKELENYKSNLDNKIYITKAKFDAEFELYRQLSKCFFNMEKDITLMIPDGYAKYPADPEKREEYESELYAKATKSTVDAQDVLNSNIPFMPDDFYQKYEEILKMCRTQINTFELRWNKLYLAPEEEKKSFSREDYQRSRDIREKFKQLNADVREYLSKLDVID